MRILTVTGARVRIAALLLLVATARPALADDLVCFDMNQGDICFRLFSDAAPVTVENFLRYVERGAYDNTLIHRSEPGLFIQGGAFSSEPDLLNFSLPIEVDPPIVNEAGRPNLRGTLAMVRGLNPDSAASQWFINVVDNPGLDGPPETGYAVFGEVVQGMDVVDKISALRVGDFSLVLNSWDFTSMPVDMAADETEADFSDFVSIERAYRTERLPGLLPYQCSLASPGDTLTEFCGSSVTFPVQIDGVLYEATLVYLPGRSGLVFAVDRSKLKALADTGQQRATFAAGVLTLPSVRNGTRAFSNVRLNLTSREPLEFTVDSFTPR